MGDVTDTADITAVTQVILRERQGRDRGWFDQQAACFHPDSRVHITWFDGTGAEFVELSRAVFAEGIRPSHRLSPPAVQLAGERAVAEVPTEISVIQSFGGVEAYVVSYTRLLYRLERSHSTEHNSSTEGDSSTEGSSSIEGSNGNWKIISLDCIYERDTLVPVVYGTSPKLDPDILRRFRRPFMYLAYHLHEIGKSVRDDLYGDDRPEQVEALYESACSWLHQAQLRFAFYQRTQPSIGALAMPETSASPGTSASPDANVSPDTTASGAARPGGPGLLGGRTVSRIGYGAMQLARLHDDRKAAVALLRRAVELGVDHVDTAQFYGDALVNEFIREALSPQDGVVVVSKIGADPNPGGPFPLRPAQRPEQLRASVEDNLRSLGLEQVPVVNLRRLDGTSRLRAEGDQLVDIDDQLAVMSALRDEGKIGAIGVSSVTLDGLRRAIGVGLACVQNEYSLVNREDEDMFELCVAEKIAWVPFFPLGGAFPGTPKVTDSPAVRAAAQSLGMTPAQVGLAWLLHHAPNVLLIPGTGEISHLEENLAAGTIPLDDPALATLDDALSSPQ
jgi:pyridoxine 4-dehydrogenase